MAGNDSNTRLLLHFDGSGTSVEDSALGGSAKSFTVTAEQTHDEAKFEASLACDVGGPNCQIGPSADWTLLALDWTLDCWAYITDAASPYLFAWYADQDNYFAVERVSNAGGAATFGFTYRIGGNDFAVGTGGTLVTVLNTWRHFCLSRSGATIRLFIDGVLHATGTLPSAAWDIETTLMPLYVGGGVNRITRLLGYLAGYIDEVRLQANSARTATFDPPLEPYCETIEVVFTGEYRALQSVEAVFTGEYVAGPEPIEAVFTGEYSAMGTTDFVFTGEYAALQSIEAVFTGEYELAKTSIEVVFTGEYSALQSVEAVFTGQYSANNVPIEAVFTGEYAAHVGIEAVFTGEYVAATVIEAVFTGTYAAEQGGDKYLLYHELDAMPDFEAAPAATSNTLPFDYVFTGEGLHYLVVRERNIFGLVSQNITPTIIELDATDTEIMRAPSAPEGFEVEPFAGAKVRVTAAYRYVDDEDRLADKWLIYTTSNGVDPDPGVDTPTVVSMVCINGIAALDWTSGAFSADQTIKVLVRTRRTSPARDSSNTTPVSTVSVSSGPSAPTVTVAHLVNGQEVTV